MMFRSHVGRALAVLAAALLAALPAAAEPRTSSDLLLPYFEVDLGGSRTTLFAVGNAFDEPVEIRASVFTNWGITVLGVTLDLDAGEVLTVNLRDWIEKGELPTQTLGPQMLAHVQAALTGQPSPNDGKYYGSEVAPGRAVGFVTLRVQSGGAHRPDSLWGDYFWVDPGADSAEGELLVDIDQGHACKGLCDRHLVRFLEGGAFDGGTELVIWTGKVSAPSPVPEPLFMPVELSGEAFHKESGAKFDERVLDLMPTQVIPLADLDLAELFGWIDIITDDPIYVGVRHAAGGFAIAVQSWCLEEPAEPVRPLARPAIDIEKLTAGADADSPPGPALEIGTPVIWEYLVRNTGNTRLSGIVVSDNRGETVTCPATSLRPGGAMTCIASGVVQSGQYSNVGTVTGDPPTGAPVTDSDPSHYLGVEFAQPGEPAIVIEKLTNGHDADEPTGPSVEEGSPVTWTYVVTNVGGTALTAVTVADSDPLVSVSCPKSTLAIGESMTCTASGTAISGAYANTGAVSASGGGQTVTDSDPSHYFGQPETSVDLPGIAIEKLTNGFDADGVASAPHLMHGDPVTWLYVVTNTGNTVLSNVTVTDDQGVAVSCPKTTLDVGESMTCSASGSAVASDHCYCNVGLVVASPPEGDDVTDSDPSHYCAEELPGEASVDLEKFTNGADADVAPGPGLVVGDNVQWTYVVTNTGDVTLTGVMVTDDQGVMITCPGGQPFQLEPGQSKTCFGNGVAVEGQYENVGTVSATPDGGGDNVTDSDPSHYFAEESPPPAPAIDLEKHTNGVDADSPPGPMLTVGDAVTWTFIVTNTGNVELTGVSVSDDQEGPISCPKSTLQPGESMTCSASGVAAEGQYANLGTVDADGGATSVSDSDPSHYAATAAGGDEGCTPGYWKNHTDSWPATGFATGQSVQSVFSAAATWPAIASATLLDALSFPGGSGVEAKARLLVHAAVASLLDASHPGVDYPRTAASVIADVNAALATQNEATILALQGALDADNNLGCPLN